MDMNQFGVRCRTMPMFDIYGDGYNASFLELDGLFAAFLIPSPTLGDDQYLNRGVRVPIGSCPWHEGYAARRVVSVGLLPIDYRIKVCLA